MKIIGDLEIIGIRDPGAQNERVLLRVVNTTTLGYYLIINAKKTGANTIRRLNDKVFWFPYGIEAKSGEFIRVYTVKKGKYERVIAKYGDKDAVFHNFFWGLEKPIWNMIDSDVVTVFKVNAWNTAGTT